MSQDINLELSRTATIDLVAYRADKRFRIFSWASSLLIGTIAGQAFFGSAPLAFAHRIFLGVTIVVLAGLSLIWLRLNRRTLAGALQHLAQLETKMRVVRPESAPEPNSIYELAIAILGLLALGMTFFSR